MGGESVDTILLDKCRTALVTVDDDPAKSDLKTKLPLYLIPVTWIETRNIVDRICVDDFLPFRQSDFQKCVR